MGKRVEQPTNKTAIKQALHKMTLKKQSQLLHEIISYYGLHFEGFVWMTIHKLEGRK